MSKRFAVAPVVLFAGALMFAGATLVRADDDCQKRTSKADHHLHEAMAKHGPQSPEAEHARQGLADARHYCWEHDQQDGDDHDQDH